MGSPPLKRESLFRQYCRPTVPSQGFALTHETRLTIEREFMESHHQDSRHPNQNAPICVGVSLYVVVLSRSSFKVSFKVKGFLYRYVPLLARSESFYSKRAKIPFADDPSGIREGSWNTCLVGELDRRPLPPTTAPRTEDRRRHRLRGLVRPDWSNHLFKYMLILCYRLQYDRWQSMA